MKKIKLSAAYLFILLFSSCRSSGDEKGNDIIPNENDEKMADFNNIDSVFSKGKIFIVRDSLYMLIKRDSIEVELLNENYEIVKKGDSILYIITAGKCVEPELEEISELPENMTWKPIIYLYPTSQMDVSVELNYNGELTHTYPKYVKGWEVEALPDGTLFDEDKKEYYALYWEGKPNNQFTIDKGNVVAGSETIPFLEKALSDLGLNRKEANEFIIYWLPKLEDNRYNLIHFSTSQYEEMAQLEIVPKPETLIRVMMVYRPLDKQIDIPLQDLTQFKKERKGFTVVEWGGHPLPKLKIGL